MPDKKAIISTIICVTIFFTIFMSATIVDMGFAKFASVITGAGIMLVWTFSPGHDVIKGIASLPFYVWPVIIFILIICFQFDIPILIRLIFSVCIFILQIGVAVLSQHIYYKLGGKRL